MKVSSSHDSIVSRGVTTSAGMTAHTVILAQTRVGFLTGGRKKYFLALPEDEQMVQLEKVYARATVAITRARALCLIMGPLDMKDLLGAATVMGTLMYEPGHFWAGHAHFYLHDYELSRSPPDESFIDMLKQNCCLSGPHFPPPAILEALQDYVTNYHKVRRLHLIVVDLWRPWKYNTARAREIEDSYRAAHPSWMDQEEAPADIRKQWQEARANRRMQFKVGNYRDGDRESNIRMLTGTIKADWIQLPVERYLAALPTLRHGVIAGVFRNKGAAPWAIM